MHENKCLITLSNDDLLRTYSASEVCERAGVSRRSLDRMMARGDIAPIPSSRGSGRTLRFTALELARVIYGDAVTVGA